MKKYLIILAALFSAGCSESQTKSKIQEEKPIEEIQIIEVDSVRNKKDEYIVTEEIFLLFPEEREAHFDKAKERFDQKEFKMAASEIKKALLYLNLEIDNAGDLEKKELKALQVKLEDISQRLEKKQAVTSEELEKVFHETNMTLYRIYIAQQNKAKWDYNLDRNAVSLYLDDAIQKLQNAEKWSKQKLSEEDHKTISEGKSFSKKIRNNVKKDTAALEKEWNTLIAKLKTIKINSY